MFTTSKPITMIDNQVVSRIAQKIRTTRLEKKSHHPGTRHAHPCKQGTAFKNRKLEDHSITSGFCNIDSVAGHLAERILPGYGSCQWKKLSARKKRSVCSVRTGADIRGDLPIYPLTERGELYDGNCFDVDRIRLKG